MARYNAICEKEIDVYDGDGRYQKIVDEIQNGEDVIDFARWYFNKLGLLNMIDDNGNCVYSDLYYSLRDLVNAYETEIEKPTSDYSKYNK